MRSRETEGLSYSFAPNKFFAALSRTRAKKRKALSEFVHAVL